MNAIYDESRYCYVCRVEKAKKDNPVARKGDSYIWAQKSKFSKKEYFKTEEDLDRKYPHHVKMKETGITEKENSNSKSPVSITFVKGDESFYEEIMQILHQLGAQFAFHDYTFGSGYYYYVTQIGSIHSIDSYRVQRLKEDPNFKVEIIEIENTKIDDSGITIMPCSDSQDVIISVKVHESSKYELVEKIKQYLKL